MSTGLPIEISSSMRKQNYISFCRLDIDIHKYDVNHYNKLIFKLLQITNALTFRNIPHVHLHEKRENNEHWHGAEIQVVIEGNWTTYRVCNAYWVQF